MTKYLLLDLDNTLYSCRYGLEDDVKKRMGEFSGAYLGLTPEEFWHQRRTMGEKYGTSLEWLLSEKGFTDVEAYLAAVHPRNEADALSPDPQLKNFLQSIQIPKAILTNSPREHADLILDKLELTGIFTHIFDIRQFGFKGKPHANCYNTVLKTLGVNAADVLFIDDSDQYTESFIALGGRALLLDENGTAGNYRYPKIRELKELERYL